MLSLQSPAFVGREFLTLHERVMAGMSTPQLRGNHFANNGKSVFFVSTTNDTITEFILDRAFELQSSLSQVVLDLTTQVAIVLSFAWKPDGTKLFVGGVNIFAEWDLSVPFDLSTATTSGTLAITGNPKGMTLTPDGLKLYWCDDASNLLEEFTLSSAFDITTATQTSTLDIQSDTEQVQDIVINSAGTKVIILDIAGDRLIRYTLSTPFLISSGTQDQLLSIGTEFSIFEKSALEFRLSTTKGDQSKVVFTVSFDLTTGTHTLIYQQIPDDEPRGFWIKSDGTRFFTVAEDGGDLDSKDMNPAFTLILTNFLTDAGAISPPRGTFLRANGLETFAIDTSGPTLESGTLTPAFNTEVWDDKAFTFSLAAGDGTPSAVAFNSDGTKMFIAGQSAGVIDEWELSSAFVVSSATLERTQSVSAQDPTPAAIAFNSDGSRFYMIGNTNKTIFQYSLSTPYLITSITLRNSFDVSDFITTPFGLYLKDDETQIFVCEFQDWNMFRFDLQFI